MSTDNTPPLEINMFQVSLLWYQKPIKWQNCHWRVYRAAKHFRSGNLGTDEIFYKLRHYFL